MDSSRESQVSDVSVIDRRLEAVEASIGRIREIEGRQGVTHEALESIKSVMVELASRTELFPPEQFPVPSEGKGTIYRLAEDPDLRFALYASVGVPGKAVPPHNHTTWAVISGVYGDEHNVFYERTDNRSTSGQGSLRKTGELTVRRGNAVGFLPDDFHTIEVTSGEHSLHLHMYGLGLEHLHERIFFEGPTGGAYKTSQAGSNIKAPVVRAQALKAMLNDGGELALLDVREEGVFSKRHLLFACPLPLSRLELGIDALVPRRDTRIVLCDDNDGLAHRAAAKLMHFGYRNLSVLAGGVEGWAEAGYELFSGVHVPSKAFGEFVEHHDDTPRLEAVEVKALVDGGADVVILDSRPMDEFNRMSIPGGIDCPGAELVYRVHDVVKSPKTTVVVNCAGRTRSIIGAQSLINAGIKNRVVALKNGTMGWHLAGLELAKGEREVAPLPTVDGAKQAQAAAERVAKRFGVRRIQEAELAKLARDDRSLYLLDVRSPEEYLAGHRPGARSAPGGQLVQATDQYVGTRNARLVLIDNDGVRATMTASWLIQMGWNDVFVLEGGLSGPDLAVGAEPHLVRGLAEARPETIDPVQLKAAMAGGGVVVIDLDSSLRYRDGHIPGAWFAARSRLKDALEKIPSAKMFALTSSDGVLARLAAPELSRLTGAAVKVLARGTDGWRDAGLPLAAGFEHMASDNDDVWYKPYDKSKGIEAAMKEYLSWEVDLVAQIERDGDARFKTFPQ